MKYKCLCLDHDDTVVNSTATIHYPCFMQYLGERYPHLAGNYTLESYFVKNFHPGVTALFRDEIGLSAEQMAEEEAYWRAYVKNHIPDVYVGMREILTEFSARGGIIAVTSHSYRHYIERDYRHHRLPEPSVIYGWDLEPELRKPSPWSVLDAMERFSLSPSDILVVDDLKPGYDMARGAGVDFAAAGWAYDVPEIESFMRQNCDFYLPTVEDFAKLIL